MATFLRVHDESHAARPSHRAAMGGLSFAEALAEGRRLTPDEAAAHAVAALKERALP
jgi:hypothetical protein